ncbi:regulatory protein RecX [Chloroflexota bacterium]
MKVTALRTAKGRKKRINVLLDGRFAFNLNAEVVVRENLQVGQELSLEQIEALSGVDNLQRGLDTAARSLGYRPRSEAEIREELRRCGFNGDVVETVVNKLKENGLVDDVAFAQFWKDNRESFSPRSQRLTRLELRQKGVDDEVISQVVDSIDDSESAYRAAQHKVHDLPDDYHSFRRRLGGYLQRRGFDYEVINQTLQRIWQGRGNSPG